MVSYGGAQGRAIATKPYGGFGWFEDPPRPAPAAAAPAPAAAWGAVAAAPAAAAPTFAAPPDVEREYAGLRVAYSNRSMYQGQVAPVATYVRGATAYAAATMSMITSHTGDFVEAPFVHTVYERARPDRVYEPPQLLKVDHEFNPVKGPDGRLVFVPLIEDRARMRVVRRRLDRRLRFDGDEEDEGERLRAEPARPSVIIGFKGVNEYTAQLKSLAVQLAEGAEVSGRDRQPRPPPPPRLSQACPRHRLEAARPPPPLPLSHRHLLPPLRSPSTRRRAGWSRSFAAWAPPCSLWRSGSAASPGGAWTSPRP